MIIEQRDNIIAGLFECMASPCEILIESNDHALVKKLLTIGRNEAFRIEQKYSRYRSDNIVFEINNSSGEAVGIDAETYRLLSFADQCFQISDGLFDITSGVLRQVWRFDAAASLPRQQDIEPVIARIGWQKIRFDDNHITLPEGMELDFGGIGKEYAVDRVLTLLTEQSDCNIMVNFGGDCHANAPPGQGDAWITGIENPFKPGDAAEVIRLKYGALATSGDAYRFIESDGIRYGHIINPKTGWPAENAPRSVTVASGTCIEAGIISTLAILHGSDAEIFLEAQDVDFWCYR